MKFQVSMKCPDALDMAIEESTYNQSTRDKAKKMCEKWFEYGEYLTVEIDTDLKTCKVKEMK